jgi:hypothetical protein
LLGHGYSYDRLTVANIGDGPVFLSHLTVTGNPIQSTVESEHRRFTQTWIANIEVAADNIGVRAYMNPDVSKTLQTYTLVTGGTNDAWKQALLRANFAEEVIDGDSCFVYVVLFESDPLFVQARERFGSALRTFPLRAALHYFSSRTKRLEVLDVPVPGVLARKPGPKCERP